jgi:hypothetical protein
VDADTETLIRDMWASLATGQRNLELRLESKLGAKLDRLETKVDAIADRLAALEARVGNLELDLTSFKRIAVENFARTQRNFELLLAEVRDPQHKERLDRIESRLVRLELHVGLPPEER